MNKKSYLVTVICLLLAFSIFSTTTAMAASTTDPVYMNDINVFNEDELVIAPQSGAVAAKVLVFLRDLLIGYVIEGVFTYATGHSPGELTAAQIDKVVKFVKNNPGYTSVHISSNGGVFGGGGRDF